LKVTVEPGFSVWKIVPISVNVAFNDAAANTVSVPDAAGAPEPAVPDDPEVAAFELDAAAEDTAAELAADEAAALVLDEAAVVPLEPQPTSRVATAASVAITPRWGGKPGRLTRTSRSFDEHRGRLDHGPVTRNSHVYGTAAWAAL
jgi:hypothetical protein